MIQDVNDSPLLKPVEAAPLDSRALINTRGGVFLAVLAGMAVAVPYLNMTGALPDYAVSLFGKYLCYALLAIALDLVWGYAGILSLGHGAFFALGGYAMGMHLMREIGDRGVYANPLLPDFMVFLNWKELPWFWLGFDMFWFALLMALFVPGLLAFVFGWFAFRSRVTGVYLSIITQALTYALMLLFFLNEFGFGGNNGLTDFKDVLGFDLQADGTRRGLFVLSALAVAFGFLICRWVTISKLGKVLVSVRDAESRTRFFRDVGRSGRRALCPASRDHQPERILTCKLNRDCGLGRAWRARNTDRSRHRSDHRRCVEEHPDWPLPGCMALYPRRAVHLRHDCNAERRARRMGQDRR